MANYNLDKQKAYDVILHLADNFQNGIKSKNETETRRYYIDKFFEALGWDVSNEKGKREVIHEDIVKVKGKTKFPDYGFYFKGKRVFFVEAKDTKVDIKNDSKPAFQLRSYAWSAKLGVSILTDFEELAIYDCTVRPKENDRTEAGRIKYFTYEDYLKEDVFDYIYDLFERENVANGSLDAYSENLCNRKGSETVDVHFLSTLDELRTKLAVVISKLNREMSEKNINYAVQQIIDRIIFLRVAEDRNVENYGLLALANPKNKNEDDFKNYGFNGENSYYENLNYIFNRANEKYNSGLFNEDEIVKNLNIDDKTIKEIIEELYTPKNPYQFSVIPVEIIGNAYEQFLGKTISIDKNHKAVIELKPEVRKAGGVYYTPEYIVDYIVANTVGEAIKGKTPDEIANIKILDPACGSGSFLLGAYKYLLNYHKEYFLKNKTKKYMGSRFEIMDESGNLALWVRKQILINNIFGVDIDSNAVEVAKLSLLLKSFEDSFNVNEYGQGSLLNEKILPTLDNNIKCGNSLIGNDFYGSQSMLDFDEKTRDKMNCFDWEEEFKSIFKGGGFDVVIGNPPYVDSEEMVKSSPLERNYCSLNYKVASGNWDLYCVFSEKSINLLKDNGYFGYIIPNKFLSLPYGEHLRLLFSKYHIKNIRDYSSVTVFVSNNKKINVYPIVITLNKTSPKIGVYNKMISEEEIDYQKEFLIDNTFEWSAKFDKEFELIDKVVKKSKLLGDDFIIENSATVSEAYEIKEYLKDDNNINSSFMFINTGTIDRYSILWGINNTQYIKDKYNYPIVEKEIIKSKFPKRYDSAIKEKIIAAGMVNKLEFCYDDSSNILSGKSTTIIMNKEQSIYNLKYILGLLNSKLYNLVFKSSNKHNSMSGGYMNVNKNSLSNFIYYPLDMSNKKDKEMHDKIVTLVDNIIALNKNLAVEKNPNSITMLNRQINAVDKQIDALVYKLYNLNDEEVRIIEGE